VQIAEQRFHGRQDTAAAGERRTLEDAGRADRVLLTGVATALTAMGGMALALLIVGVAPWASSPAKH
jgi:hypothetical protein